MGDFRYILWKLRILHILPYLKCSSNHILTLLCLVKIMSTLWRLTWVFFVYYIPPLCVMHSSTKKLVFSLAYITQIFFNLLHFNYRLLFYLRFWGLYFLLFNLRRDHCHFLFFYFTFKFGLRLYFLFLNGFGCNLCFLNFNLRLLFWLWRWYRSWLFHRGIV